MNNVTLIINNMTIKERGDGRFEGRITNDGIRKSFYGKTKTEVKRKAKEYLTKIENGFKEPKKIIFNEYIEYWLKTYKWNKLEPSSYARLYSVYDKQIKNSIGMKAIGEITTKDIQRIIDEHANPTNKNTKPLSLSGLKKIIQLIRPCMNMAISEEIIYKNPCDNVILPKESCIRKKTKKQYSLTDSELKQLKDAALSKYITNGEYCSRNAFIILLIVNLGLRVGEVLALNWDDIDFKNRIIYINKTIQSDKMDGYNEMSTHKSRTRVKMSAKTNCGNRILQLNEEVLWYLEQLKNYDTRNNIVSDFVCCRNTGTRETARNLQRSLDRLVKKTNINKQINLHILRHTFGSTLLRNGVNIEVISKLMGHANISITYNKYIHSIKEEEAKAMNMIKIC